MRLRQIALVARELEPVVDDLCAVLGLEVCYRDPGVAEFGLHNALMPIGTSFLEVVSPDARGHHRGPAARAARRRRRLHGDRADRRPRSRHEARRRARHPRGLEGEARRRRDDPPAPARRRRRDRVVRRDAPARVVALGGTDVEGARAHGRDARARRRGDAVGRPGAARRALGSGLRARAAAARRTAASSSRSTSGRFASCRERDGRGEGVSGIDVARGRQGRGPRAREGARGSCERRRGRDLRHADPAGRGRGRSATWARWVSTRR